MNPEEVAVTPGWVQAVEVVVTEAQQAGEYPAIFDDEQLPSTLHKVIVASRLPIETVRDLRNAHRNAAYHVGRHLIQHQL